MKTSKLWKVLSLCVIGLVFLASHSFVISQKAVALSPLTVSTTMSQAMVTIIKYTVIVKGMTFEPVELHVHKGDTVLWIYKDIVAHNVTDFPGAKWTSGTLALGSSWEKNINDTFDYYCSIHPTMKGKLVVDL